MKKGEGSGSKGAVVKRDIVKQILKHLFPDCSEEDLLWMLNYTAPENKPKASSEGDSDNLASSLQYMVSCLDPENCEEFKEIVKQAKEELWEKALEKGKQSANADVMKGNLLSQLEEAQKKIKTLESELKRDVAPHKTAPSPAASSGLSRVGETHVKVTPKDFRTLFPFAGKIAGLAFKHDVGKKFVLIVYPRCSGFIWCSTCFFLSGAFLMWQLSNSSC